MKICILTLRYPSVVDPTSLTFVQQLAWQFADEGQDVDVICPLPLHKFRDLKKIPQITIEHTEKGNKVTVYHPRSIYFGQIWLGKWNTAYLSTKLFKVAVDSVLFRIDRKPDVLYGHFITPAGISASLLGRKYSIRSFVAYGESTPWTIDQVGREKVKKLLEGISGVISVSTSNKEEIIHTGVVEEDKVEVFPNGYNPDRFSPKDKFESRKLFNLPQNKYIVAFVGHFIERKGIHVLKQAVDQIPDAYLICAGKGKLKPEGRNVLFADTVNPNRLAYFYSAADCFVLPTSNEGCCNAIIEAMACGLPIISSNQPFNDDILDDNNSIRIDPHDIQEVKNAIVMLMKDDNLRKEMGKASLKKAKSLTIQKRTENILGFFDRMK